MKRRRLDQLLASLGYGSRREVKELIAAGLVTVGGEVTDVYDAKVEAPEVRVQGEPLEAPEGLIALFHKPVGYVCTHAEKEGPTIYDLLPPRWLQRNPAATSVGRLDKDTSGALLLTDRGDLVQRWTSPKSEIEKVYEVEVDQALSNDLVQAFSSGELLLHGESKACLPAQLVITGEREATLTLTEGRYHQVRRMFASFGWTVTKLHRSRFGVFTLSGLAAGEWREVTEAG